MTKDQEIENLRRRLAAQNTDAAANELILRRAQKRELSLLEADSLIELAHALTAGLENSFGVPEATVVLCDPDHEVRHLVRTLSNEPLPDGIILTNRLDTFSPVYRDLRKTWLGPFESRHERLFRHSDKIASVAIMPLARDRSLMGSLNLGSGDRTRFTREHATDFLSHLGVIASFCLENAVNRARLRRSGFTDVLTGWHNRRYLEQRLLEEVSRAQRNRHWLACLMIDIDHFKQVNDNHGHLAGDEVLRRVAERIATQVRTSDVAARFGGEEFIVLLPDTDEPSATKLAERIREVVRASPIRVDADHALTVTVSVGAAAHRAERGGEVATKGRALIEASDSAMYQAKKAGRDRVVAAEPIPFVNEID